MADQALPVNQEPSTGSTWVRRYPPLSTLVVALLIAFIVLPSALNIPQSNPSTVLEFAPVPPEDDTPPPNSGSLSTLGLGTSSSLSAEVDVPPPSVGGGPRSGGRGDRPVTKRCVGEPARQTEDPNSPPCVPYFEGDNGGNTWQGVTGNEVVALIYATGSVINAGGSSGTEQSPAPGRYCDLDGPADSQPGCVDPNRGNKDWIDVRVARAMSRYFNDRFMTYNRRVHFWMYFSTGSATPSSRRSDAQANWERLKPFAVLDNISFGGYNAVYAEAAARRGMLVFGNFSGLPNRFYRNNAPYIWTFWPDVEHWVEMYTSYICQTIAGNPVAFGRAGPSQQMNGRPRKYGFLSTADAEYGGLQEFAKSVRERLRAGCPNGVRIDGPSRTFPNNQYAIDSDTQATQVARQNIALFQQEEVTTILWLAGYEVEHSKAARAAGYYPEWIVAGDLLNDQIEEGRFQDQEVWRNAVIASNQLREDSRADSPCRQAYREAEPRGWQSDENRACGIYREFFTIFRSIQAAGPFLSPEAVDQGNHAIPRRASNNPAVAACFYDPGDYSCVKDSQESWWDPDARDPEGDADERGCWRMARGGARYLAWEWPGSSAAFQNPSDPCMLASDGTYYIQ
ncbi:MAG TPA: hypothetical protein VM840_09305 [Actinomycetota bacterium]|nr:hypothetical protein [Actinomycetota bacterium]